MAKPSVLIIENAVDVTGGLNAALRSSDTLRNDFDFTFVLPTGSRARQPIERLRFSAVEFPLIEIRRNAVAIFRYGPSLLFNMLRLFRLVGKKKCDVIVANDFYNLLPAVYRMFGGKQRYICYVRFLPSALPRRLVRGWLSFHLRYAEKIIAVSNAVAAGMPAHRKVVRIYDPLPASDPGPFEYPQTSRVVLCLANYIPGKGQPYLLESFAAIAEKFPEWTLRMAGSDMGLAKNSLYKNALIHQAAALGIADRVEFLSATNDPFPLYAASAFTVNFSDSESFSLTCMESLFAGRPVIATRSGGPAEIIDDGTSGLLVQVRNIFEMSAALTKLMQDALLRESMGREGFRRVREKFDPSETTMKLAAVYLSLVQPNKEP